MGQTFESGHAKNVANFHELVLRCAGLGAAFAPSLESIGITAMQEISVNADNAIDQVKSALPVWSNAVAERDKAFAPLNGRLTRVMNALKASGIDKQELDNARTIARKIVGARARRKLTDEEKKTRLEQGIDVNNISVSQMSFDSRIDNLNGFIHYIKSLSGFAPNEADLQVPALEAYLEDLRLKNLAVKNAAIPLNKARILRNQILYEEKTGLVARAILAKAYVKSIFGAKHPNYKSISSLSFRSESLS